MKTITSRKNPEIMNVVALKQPKERAAQKKFIAEGERTITTLLQGPIKEVQIYLLENTSIPKHINPDFITYVPESVMEKISSLKTPSPMLGVFEIPPTPQVESLGSAIVLADISDPGNAGTLIRTAAAFGESSVIVVDGVDPWSPKVVQASTGTIGNINVYQWSWGQVLENKGNKKLCALVAQGGQQPNALDLKNNILVIGNEAHGLPPKWLAECDEKITLPMAGGTESLNAAVAGAIALYLRTNSRK